MKQFALKRTKFSRFLFDYGNLLLAFISIIALLLTFVITISEIVYTTKVIAFAFIITAYVSLYIILHTLQKNQLVEIRELLESSPEENVFDSYIEEKLLVLEEAGKFFSVSLKTVDMFRLISSRINEIIPYSTCVVFEINQENEFRVPYAKGKNSRLFESLRIECGEGIAGKAFLNQTVEYDQGLELDKEFVEETYLIGLESAIAIPLFREGEVFSVLVLYGEKPDSFEKIPKALAEAVGERIMPLINGSIAFEKSMANALTDKLTNLPNERAFHLILENQVAEAHRFFERRSLSILAIDIKNFSEINKKFGHSVGDIILSETAERIKQQIRRMDFVSRTSNDEFLVILPTASEEISEQVIKRINSVFESKPIAISSKENCFVNLNFGLATFQNDGETAEQLIKMALVRKRQGKSEGENSVLYFPKKYIS